MLFASLQITACLLFTVRFFAIYTSCCSYGWFTYVFNSRIVTPDFFGDNYILYLVMCNTYSTSSKPVTMTFLVDPTFTCFHVCYYCKCFRLLYFLYLYHFCLQRFVHILKQESDTITTTKKTSNISLRRATQLSPRNDIPRRHEPRIGTSNYWCN